MEKQAIMQTELDDKNITIEHLETAHSVAKKKKDDEIKSLCRKKQDDRKVVNNVSQHLFDGSLLFLLNQTH